MKIMYKILCCFLLIGGSFLYAGNSVFAVTNLDTDGAHIEISDSKNDYLDDFATADDRAVTEEGAEGIAGLILKIAKDFKNIVFAIATVILLVLVFKLLFASNTEEEASKFKQGVTWVLVGIVVMQLSFTAVVTLFDKKVDDTLAKSLIEDLFLPITNVLLFGAAFAFLFVGIVSFYLLVTANGDEEKVKKGKMTIVYAVIGFIVIKIADIIVNASYSGTYNPTGSSTTKLIELSSTIINWVSTFIALTIILMLMYSGFQVLTGLGDEEKIKSFKNTLVYIGIGLLVLVMNFLIVTFFLSPAIV